MQLFNTGTDQESAGDQDNDTTGGLNWLGIKSRNLMLDLGEGEGLKALSATVAQ